MPDGVNVSSVLNDQKLTLQFNSVLNFDLADAKVAAPPNIASINQRADIDASAVDIVLIGEVDVHSFREEKNYVVDVAFQQAEKPALAAPNAEAKPAVPAKPGSASRISRDKALKESPPPRQPAPAASSPPPESGTRDKAATVEARRDSDGLRVTFSFATPTPAALFRRADTVWLVFDHAKPIDIEPIRAKGGAVIGDVSRLPLEKGQGIRIRLNRPQIPSLESEGRANGAEWTLTFARSEERRVGKGVKARAAQRPL